MSENEKMLNFLDNYLNQLQQADVLLNCLFNEKNIDAIEKKLSLSEYAKLNVSCAYALNSFYYQYMKIHSIPLENHKINDELERVKQYMQKVQETIRESSGAKEEEKKEENPIKLNQNATARLIKNSLSNEQTNKKKKEKSENIWKEETTEVIQKKTKKEEEKQILHKGAVMPSQKHLNWKKKIEEMLN